MKIFITSNGIYIYLGKFHHDLTSPEPWNHGFYRGIIPKGPQVSGKWIIIICPTHTHIYIYTYIHTYIHKCQSVRKWRIVHCHVSGGWIILIQPVIESKWWTHGFFFFWQWTIILVDHYWSPSSLNQWPIIKNHWHTNDNKVCRKGC